MWTVHCVAMQITLGIITFMTCVYACGYREFWLFWKLYHRLIGHHAIPTTGYEM